MQPVRDLPRLRAAIVGAGPAGFYAAEELLAASFNVDMYEALPTPFGLVRAGVAPDHPKIKAVTRRYARVAAQPGFRFFGGVALGTDIQRDELLARYHAVLYAVGAADGNRLGIAGEERPGSHAATEFVAWYNGHPDYADRAFELGTTRAVVIGHGNVAIDVARILQHEPDALAATDVADHALVQLATSRIEQVLILGRRGPAQASFTNPELLELGELPGIDVVVDPAEAELDAHSAAWLDVHGSAIERKKVEIVRRYAARTRSRAPRRIELRFLSTPVELLGDGADGPVTGLRIVRNRIEPDASGKLCAVPTGEEEILECGLVVRSVGYRGRPLAGVPFDRERGRICNAGGRVHGDDGRPHPGEYAVGWIKRGPSGVIGTNKKDAGETVARVIEDRDAGRLNEPAQLDGGAIDRWLRTSAPGLVRWRGWEAIDRHETARGEPLGRPRVKLVRVADMLDVTRGAPAR